MARKPEQKGNPGLMSLSLEHRGRWLPSRQLVSRHNVTLETAESSCVIANHERIELFSP